MRSAALSLRLSVRCVLAALFAVCFAGPALSQTTTFQGTVYSPYGPTKTGSAPYAGDPIPNILVFVQDTFNSPGTGDLPTFNKGVTVPTSGLTGCDAQPNLVPKTVLGSSLTDAAGKFTFAVTASTLPDPVVIVIQAGKWRRVYSYPASTFTAGGTNSGLQLVMPSAKQAGVADLPQIAVVTGSADEVECIFPQIGIAASEITDVNGTGSINLFKADGSSGGSVVTASSYHKGSDLLNPASSTAVPITNYDLVIYGCTGSPTADASATASYTASALQNYTADGGRLLMTHYEWPFLTTAFPTIGTFYSSTPSNESLSTVTGVLNPSYSGYATLEGWMANIGALTATSPQATFKLPNPRGDVKTYNHSIVDLWATVPTFNLTADNPAIQFSFNTPLGQAGVPTISVVYTNNSSQYVRGDTGDSINVNVTNTGTIATSGATLTLQLSLPSAFVNPVLTSPGNAWTCTTQGQVATCVHPAPLAAGASDSILVTFGISSTATPGNVSVNSTISGGNINQSEQCGRVLFNDYHVENGTPPTTFSASGCSSLSTGGLSAAQKFLEYSLYALSNFVSPSTSDAIKIVALPSITWTPTAQDYYGTPFTTIETPAPTTEVPGSTTYTYTPNTGVTPLDVGTYTFTANFTPTDSTNYLSNSTTATITILQDPTQSLITNLTGDIFYGQEIGYDATNGSSVLSTSVMAPGYTGVSVTGGTWTLSLNGTAVCTGTQGTPLSAGKGPNGCADAPFIGLNAGTYALGYSYAGTTDFAASSAAATAVKIHPDSTATVASSSNTSVAVHTNLTFTASTSDTYTPAVGTVVFYDSTTAATAAVAADATPNVVPAPAGAVAIGTQPLAANGTVSLSLANLNVGTHYIVACFVGLVNSSSTYNFRDSCSDSITQVITLPPTAPLGTQSLLATSVNPASVGQAISFTATVKTTGAFTQIPTGTVTFSADGTTFATANIQADGTAVATTSTLALGSHSIVASFTGNSTMSASTSTTLTEVVQTSLAAAGSGFLLNITPTTVSVPVGGSTVVTVQVVELTDFNQPVSLTCSGLPDQSSCIFAQSTIPAGGGTTQMLLTAASPHNCNSSSPYFVAGNGWGWPLFGVSLLTLCAARRRKKLQAVALTVMLIALPAALTGCGSGNCTDFGTKPGTYTFTVTATSKGSPSVVKSQTMTMNAHI